MQLQKCWSQSLTALSREVGVVQSSKQQKLTTLLAKDVAEFLSDDINQ